MAHNLLDHGAHLVYFYGVDDKVLSLVFILGRCNLEAAGNLLNSVVENIGETYEDRCCHIAQLQFVH